MIFTSYVLANLVFLSIVISFATSSIFDLFVNGRFYVRASGLIAAPSSLAVFSAGRAGFASVEFVSFAIITIYFIWTLNCTSHMQRVAHLIRPQNIYFTCVEMAIGLLFGAVALKGVS